MKRRQVLAGGAALCASTVFGRNLQPMRDSKLYVPPEESPHKRTFMQWPVSRRVYRDRIFQEIIQQTIADIANTISEFEPVVLLAAEEHHRQVRSVVSNGVELWDIPTDDLWCRDSGPLFAKDSDGKLVISHLQFNGWGDKQTHSNDAQIAAHISKRLDIPLVSSGLVGEAGGVDHDGHGLLMAHESSWVNDNRNPGLSRAEIEKRLLSAYGAQTMIWSPGVWDEDITDYHIDSLARFTSAGRVLINLPQTPDRQDPFHRAALETYDALLAADLDVDVISEPEYRRVDDIEFVASYANYYACNGGIVAAQFGDAEADERALEALQQHYPNREVVSLNVDALGEVGGGIHCATQQMPA
ncbi:MAG: agmatine/peptidylarginine deiminase [Granulosicoccus sp.]